MELILASLPNDADAFHIEKAIKSGCSDFSGDSNFDPFSLISWRSSDVLWNLLKPLNHSSEFVEFLNSVDKQGKSALHLACIRLHDHSHEIIEELLKHQADPSLKDVLHQTPLHYLCHPTLASTLNPLTPRSAHLSVSNQEVLMEYHVNGLLGFLRNCGPKPDLINAQAHEGWTPLHYCCKYGFYKSVTILLQYGANIKLKLSSPFRPLEHMKTPLEIAGIYAKNSGIEELFLDWVTKGTVPPELRLQTLLDQYSGNESNHLIIDEDPGYTSKDGLFAFLDSPRRNSDPVINPSNSNSITYNSNDSVAKGNFLTPREVKIAADSADSIAASGKAKSSPLMSKKPINPQIMKINVEKINNPKSTTETVLRISDEATDPENMVSPRKSDRKSATKKRLNEQLDRLSREILSMNSKLNEQKAHIERLEAVNNSKSRKPIQERINKSSLENLEKLVDVDIRKSLEQLQVRQRTLEYALAFLFIFALVSWF